MTMGAPVEVSGYITQDKYLLGRPLSELERYLGFKAGRLSCGATFIKLTKLPAEGEFELAGYSMVAAHRHSTPPGLDVSKLKLAAISRWSLSGPDRLVKVLPGIRHDEFMDPDEQYPPGAGVPQWKLLVPLPGTVVAEPKTAAEKYRPVN